MWKKIAPLLVVLSVALNVAFLGVWAVRVFPAQRLEDGASGDPVWCPLHRALKVTDEQWRRLEPRLAEFRRKSEAIRAEMGRLRAELIDRIDVVRPDREAIASKQEEIRAGQRRMQHLVIEHLLAEKEVLTADQEKELFDLLRRRTACAGPGRMLGLSGMDSDRPVEAQDAPQSGTSQDRGE